MPVPAPVTGYPDRMAYRFAGPWSDDSGRRRLFDNDDITAKMRFDDHDLRRAMAIMRVVVLTAGTTRQADDNDGQSQGSD